MGFRILSGQGQGLGFGIVSFFVCVFVLMALCRVSGACRRRNVSFRAFILASILGLRSFKVGLSESGDSIHNVPYTGFSLKALSLSYHNNRKPYYLL